MLRANFDSTFQWHREERYIELVKNIMAFFYNGLPCFQFMLNNNQKSECKETENTWNRTRLNFQ